MRWQTLARARIGVIGAALFALAAIAPHGTSFAADKAATTQPPAGHPTTGDLPARKKAAPAAPVKRVDINKASRAELKTLPGIGDAEADKIIAKRPFLTKADLVTQKILPEGVYVSIRHQIIATQAGKPPHKK
jgi:DNA uptake protein ComE-like DNA-binding protein